MPIDYRIDQDQNRVYASAHGTMTTEQLFDYQKKVWSKKEVAGMDELVDLTNVEGMAVGAAGMQSFVDLASSLALSIPPGRLAIVASGDFEYGLSRTYKEHREKRGAGAREVGVFQTLEDAEAFLKS